MVAEGGGFTSSEALIEGVLTGQVPHQVRLFAAQGLLPVSRDDLFRLQAALSADPDEELAEMAAQSLREQEAEVMVRWLEEGHASPIELDLLIRVVRKDEVWAAVAQHSNVSEETLCLLARHGSPIIQDIIITNQVRLLACLEILDNLRSNTQVTKVVLRRVKEFEEQFIEKVAHQFNVEQDSEVTDDLDDLLPELEGSENPSIKEPVDTLHEIGANIPAEEELAYETEDDEALKAAVKKGGSAFSRIIQMDIKGKILVGIRGSREERAILINSRNSLVLRSVLASPKITDSEIETFAASKSVSDEVVRIILRNPRWLRRYGVIQAITSNPKTPAMTAIRMLPQLAPRDLKIMIKDRNVNNTVRRKAKEILENMTRR